MKVNPFYYGLNQDCTRGLMGPDGKVCVSCISNTVSYILRATYAPSNDTEVKEIVRQLLQH